ncbi:hypothetical protein NHF48_002845 [Sphingomonas sp. H160509]|uniref:hypothetical protein n=1 Tax=Sphingomonas sp. H160509 TaxID=2955313 RepID=UPI002097CC21|nr:hypothetical protein [Sphingomonas sp. H160509]MDD1450140.1 hypothetical protein [Sphingomonas sp. H160509]
MRAIRRDERDDPSGKKRPADGEVMRDMMRTIDGEDLRSYRDRALLAIGMAGGVPSLRAGGDDRRQGVGRHAQIADPSTDVED